MPPSKHTAQVPLSESAMDRIEALRDSMTTAGVRPSKAAAIRAAIEAGLDALHVPTAEALAARDAAAAAPKAKAKRKR